MSLLTRAGKGAALTQSEMDNNFKEVGAEYGSFTAAATMDLNVAGNIVTVTGNTGISSFASAAPTGTTRILYFTGTPLITHGASAIVLPGARNFQVRAGDVLVFKHEGSGKWRCIDCLRGDGSALVSFLQLPAVYDNGNLGATPTINPANGAYQKGTTSATITTFTISAPPGNLPMTLHVDIYQAAGANYTVSWAAAHKWKAGADKALTATNGARDHLVGFYDGSAWLLDLMKGIA